MLDFMTNNKEYEIRANGQLTSILSQFDSDYIMHIVADTLENQFSNFDTIMKPNVVQSFEQVFKQLIESYETDTNEILASRLETYQAIIHILKSKFGFEFQEYEMMDWYTVTFYLYDFFVSNFNNYLVNFYSRYITDNKDDIYKLMNLEQFKKQKDTSTIYGKYAFENNENLAIIVARLPQVLSSLTQMNVPDELVYQYSYGNNPQIVGLFINHISLNIPLFQMYNNILFNKELYADVITQIRMKIQMDNQQEIMDAAKAIAGK